MKKAISIYSEDNLDILVNGTKLNVEETYVNENSYIMVPLRLIAEQLNYSIKWKSEEQTIQLLKENELIELKVGGKKVSLNGKNINLNSNIIVKEGKVLVPIQFFDKVLNLNIGFNKDKSLLRINTPRKNTESYFDVKVDKATQEKLEEYINALKEFRNFHGSILVAKEGKVLLNKGYGYANFEQEITNKSQTKFAIGSVTKQFTAMAIMQLTEKNLINVEDKVSKYVSGLAHGDKITIHNLLSHTSGLTNYTGLKEFLELDYKDKDSKDIINLIKVSELEFQPGERFSYSNTNYLLLDIIAEKVSNMPLEDYFQENIFKPLNMNDTGVTHGKNKEVPDATAYAGFIDVYPIDDGISSQAYGAGNMYSTVEDLYRWDRTLKTEKLVKKETMDKIFEIHINFLSNQGYGYGWMVNNLESEKKVSHTGGTLGFASTIDRYINEDLTVIVSTNKGHYDIETLSDNLKNISLKKKYELPEELKEIEIENTDIYDKYVGEYKYEGENEYLNGTQISIRKKEDGLYAKIKNQYTKITGELEFKLFPKTEQKFFAKSINVQIELMSNDEGEITKINFEQMGLNIECERLE